MNCVKALKYYPYRTAQPKDTFIIIPREFVKNLEEELNRQVNKHPDNHYTIKFEFDNEHGFLRFDSELDRPNYNIIYAFFHDGNVFFSSDIYAREP